YDRWLYAAAFVFGMALGVHHATVGLVLPAFAVLVLRTEGLAFFTSRRLLKAAAVSFLGLGIYAYLPIAAFRSPLMNWGDPRTLERFLDHITGWQYHIFFQAKPEGVFRQLTEFFTLVLREFGPAWFPATLLLAIGGFTYLYRRGQRAVFWFLAVTVLANLAYNVNYEIAEDKDAYFLPVFLSIAIATGVGAHWLAQAFNQRSFNALAPILLVVVILVEAYSNYAYDNRRHYFIARDYVQNILSTVEPGGMLLTMDWQVYSPMFYMREIEGYRRDVVVIDINQLRRSWYFDYLRRVYPEVMGRAGDRVDAFLEDLKSWEHDPDLYQRDLSLNKRISQRFRDLILGLISNHLDGAPVYITRDVALFREGDRDSDWAGQLSQIYQQVPQGLVFELFRDKQFHEPASSQFETRGLADGSLHFERDDVVNVKVLPVYSSMLYARGRYLAAAHRDDEARECYRKASEFMRE